MGQPAGREVSDFYGTLRENAARAPRVPCHLAAPLREVWNGPTRFGGHSSEPLLLADAGRIFVADKDRHRIALDASTQARLWRSPWPSNAAFLHEGHLFHWVSGEDLQLVDLETGLPKRSIHAPRAAQALASGPILAACADDYDYGGERLYALDWTTGRRLWSEPLPRNHALEGVMTASEDVLVYGVVDRMASPSVSSIVARRLDSGRELWRKTGAAVSGIAAVHGDRIVGATGSQVWAFALHDGSLLWQADNAGAGYLYGDRFYAVGYGSRYTTFDVATGKGLRSWDLNARMPKTLQSGGARVLLVSESHVFFSSERSMLLAFTRDSGEYVSSHFPKNAYQKSEAVCAGGRFYYQNGPQRLYCLEPRG
jgi:outer membrane protein assembly factor BamB